MRSRQIGSTSSTGTNCEISIERESSCASSASSSASSTITNWPLAASQPLTISSGASSRSCLGHQRFCLIGVRHSRWSSLNETSDWRAAGFVAGARPTGMLTSPKVRDPFQVVRMSSSVESGTPHSARLSPFLHARRVDSRSMGAGADDRTALAGRGRAQPRRRRVSRPARRSLARGRLGRGGRAGREHGQRPARAGGPEGRVVRDLRPHDARMVAVRLRARGGRRRRDARSTRTARPTTRRTSSTTRSPSACCVRTPSWRPRSRSSAPRCRASGTC